MEKEYTIQVGEIFTAEKAKELQEFLELKDKETKICVCKNTLSLNVVHREFEPCYIPDKDREPHPKSFI